MEAVVCGVLKGVDEHYRKSCKKGWVESWVGETLEASYSMFSRAVFADPLPGRSLVYPLSPRCCYRAEQGKWTMSVFNYAGLENQSLHRALKTIDALLREACSYPHPIRVETSTRWLLSLIGAEIQEQLKKEEEAKRRVLTLDLRQLGKIRQNAAYTRERLLTEEEREPGSFFHEAEADEPLAEASIKTAPTPDDTLSPGLREKTDQPAKSATAGPGPLTDPPAEAESLLNDQELRYLRALLRGEDRAAFQREGRLTSLLEDSINEKLYERFGDSVILDGEAVEDYREELKEMTGL